VTSERDLPMTFVVEPGKTYDLEVLGTGLSGDFQVFSTGASRKKGRRSWWAAGKIVETGDHVRIRFTET